MNTKPWYLSKTIWGGVLAALVGALGLFGLGFPADFVSGVTDDVVRSIEAGVALVGGALAIWGRVKAVTKVGK